MYKNIIQDEYGFYIDTEIDYLNSKNFVSYVYVFDIVNFQKGNITEYGVKIEPLFSLIYYGETRAGTVLWDMSYNPLLNEVVNVKGAYEGPDYLLKDVKFKHSLRNPYPVSNYGDQGYNPYDDTGEYIVQTRYSFKGRTLKGNSNNGKFLKQLIFFGLGQFDPYGSVNFITTTISGIKNGNYTLKPDTTVIEGESGIDSLYTVWDQQLSNYGKFIRDATVTPSENSSDPLLIGMGNFVQSIYLTSRRSTTDVKTRHHISIHMQICEDETWRFLGIKMGKLNVIRDVSSSRQAPF